MTKDFLSLKPEVWAFSNYPEGSGGANALGGVAKLFAERTGLELHSLDVKPILQSYQHAVKVVTERLPRRLRLQPGPQNTRQEWRRRDDAIHDVASEIFYRTQGLPSAILTSFSSYFTRKRSYFNDNKNISTPQSVFIANNLNTNTWNTLLPDGFRGLAPYILSHEILQSEAARFHPVLKGDGKEVVGIILAESGYASEVITQALSSLTLASPLTRFVITSSPRCSSKSFSEFCYYFRSQLNPQQTKDLVTYDFHKETKNTNPYRALLTLADHMIILNESESMISDRLFAGRTAYYAHGYSSELIGRYFGAEISGKKVKYFPADIPLISETFLPVNSTAMIVDQLLKSYEAHQKAEPQKYSSRAFEVIKSKIKRSLDDAIP